MLLRELQSLLDRLYDLDVREDVRDFLITDRELLRALHAPSAEAGTPEALLVQEQAGEELSLALYLDPQLLERLDASAPLAHLTEGNLEDFCTALEGVSHFQCVAWTAATGRSVSLLGLEMQAEIDKYTLAALVASAQHGGRLPPGLHGRLFDQVRYRADLDPPRLDLYRRANHYAARFCRRLEERFLCVRRARVTDMLIELQRFYRLGDAGKLRVIEAAGRP